MNHKIPCGIIRDVLPSYIDGLTNEETNQLVKEHLEECDDCQKEYQNMTAGIEVEKAPEVKNFKKFMNKTKMIYLGKGGTLAIIILGFITSTIVDLATSHGLTWSLIVDVSLLYVTAILVTALFGKKHRVVKSVAVGSVLLLPLLYALQVTINKFFMPEPYDWFTAYALPLSVMWLVIIWIVMLLVVCTKINIWCNIGIGLILSAIGSLLTDAVVYKCSLANVFLQDYEWIDSIAMLGCGLLCFVVAYIRKGHKGL